MPNALECTYYDKCLNNDSCYRCQNMNLLKLPVRCTNIKSKRGNPWRRFEAKVATKLATAEQCRLQPASGSKWYAPGDVITPDILAECKSHPVSSKGAKQHTIRRQELQKITEEAALSGRMPLYVFQFKDDATVYAVLRFDDLEVLLKNRRN